MMKKPVDYSGFSLKRLGEPRFRHILLALGWVWYFLMYFLTENLIPAENCTVIHIFLDDLIPFCEYFAVFYVAWFPLIFFSLLFALLYDVDKFTHMQKFIIVTQVVAIACYILWPSRQDLRPEQFPRENVFTWILGLIYSVDTPTGVCPSLHVAYALGILSADLKDREMGRVWKALLILLVVMISLSVCFVKQHSAMDVLAALPLCLLAEIVSYGRDWWLPRLRGKKEAAHGEK